MSEPIQNRYEFVFYFDVENGNPNGDPDAGNMPRIDFETNHGLVTDVCLKRKVRNFVELAGGGAGREIYVREKAVLNQQHQKAYDANGLKHEKSKLPKDGDKAKAVTDWMCENFYDVRAFGAVMTTEVNAGQVRGPVQFAFARSVDPIMPQEISVTRMAVTNEKDLEKERTMGRKSIVPYALYRAEGFISAPLAEKTGFSEDDLELFWSALAQMFDHDRSAARGKMAARDLIVFKHDSKLGKAPAHKLLDRVTADRQKDENGNEPKDAPRHFEDYVIAVNKEDLPAGVEVLRPFEA
ncbi:type I-C CRISPR-associated protein Cas7/Csd2 [Ferruginivarius sediminum]|uniref:Type I-C CRISPR-associated protein Cas7/Csd2 n=1 Tax=Ferruginivarius sediminum TaxID=2661937 RepID=A0A369T9S3_9PROT|nr:type I-C CRISPR-associated protein Cas7/Csd2 [Ferruginivarius sediminum]RDD61244.1 type I-C CRISPR-associated protein Cas7/Csd2 [Ferruginivarius sediminum]